MTRIQKWNFTSDPEAGGDKEETWVGTEGTVLGLYFNQSKAQFLHVRPLSKISFKQKKLLPKKKNHQQQIRQSKQFESLKQSKLNIVLHLFCRFGLKLPRGVNSAKWGQDISRHRKAVLKPSLKIPSFQSHLETKTWHCSVAKSCPAFTTPWTVRQASLSFTISLSLLKLASTESRMLKIWHMYNHISHLAAREMRFLIYTV